MALKCPFVQVPENANDRDIIGAARDIMIASAQKFKLTYLSCKRDMSNLLALSALQVSHSGGIPSPPSYPNPPHPLSLPSCFKWIAEARCGAPVLVGI